MFINEVIINETGKRSRDKDVKVTDEQVKLILHTLVDTFIDEVSSVNQKPKAYLRIDNLGKFMPSESYIKSKNGDN